MMASIFTFDPEPPRVSSPWLHGPAEVNHAEHTPGHRAPATSETYDATQVAGGHGSGARLTHLQAEPQQGPVEYKLHLLLRPRRKFRSTSTGDHVSGTGHASSNLMKPNRSASESVLNPATSLGAATPPTGSTQQTRQHRLEQLTTQLLWRLQQSSPHHTSSATNIILPSLPEALPELRAPQQPARLLHGLEESQGALYEIGVSDDGTLVGLADDELQESLNNLRAMAACLGCTVEVLRKEVVGDCEWIEDATIARKERKIRRTGKLLVAEALIKPYLQIRSPSLRGMDETSDDIAAGSTAHWPSSRAQATEQLRITLTGPTMSGKSTLLGTLTTSTLDNGRGKSRLSMLKHRHEITSGITSSVTQELQGYCDLGGGAVEVVNYASENIASWIDVHVAASGGRLVFISDSAGHPRYRRTAVRGLVGWAPHWTFICVPADDAEDTPGTTPSSLGPQPALGSAVPDIDLSGAQLALCLKLDLPLVVVITKLDVASRSGLKNSLTKVLSALKAAGRQPAIIPSGAAVPSAEELQYVSSAQVGSAYKTCLPLLNDPVQTVPIVLTSAVQGTGLAQLHALLHELPIPAPLTDHHKRDSSPLFHIEDVYTKPAELDGIIVSGRLRTGQICVGDSMFLGPFSGHESLEDSEDSDERPARRRSAPQPLPTSRSFPGALRPTPPYFAVVPGPEWRRVRVTSTRNLRLPAHALLADQVGTIAVVPDTDGDDEKTAPSVATLARVRKGMVLSAAQPLATRTFIADFTREDLEPLAVGNHVVVYIASVRASAKVVSARAPDIDVGPDPFAFEDMAEMPAAGAVTARNLLVTFTFDATKEFVAVGDQVLIMPGGGPGLYGGHERGQKGVAGLEGFVGRVTEIHG